MFARWISSRHQGAWKLLIALAVVAFVAVGTESDRQLHAQTNASATTAGATDSSRVVTLVLVSTMPAPGGRAQVVRRAVKAPRDLVLLSTEDVTPADLVAALSMLRRARERDGGTLAAPEQRIPLYATSLGRPLTAEQDAWVMQVLARLGRAPYRPIDGIGVVQAIEIPVRDRAPWNDG